MTCSWRETWGAWEREIENIENARINLGDNDCVKKHILQSSYVSALIFVTGLLAFGCSTFLMSHVGVCAAIFSIGTVISVFVFAIAFISRNGSKPGDLFWVAVWILLMIGYFIELRHFLSHVCLK